MRSALPWVLFAFYAALTWCLLFQRFPGAKSFKYPTVYAGDSMFFLGAAKGFFELNRWIASMANGTENLHLFRTFEDLAAKISEIWDAPPGAIRIAYEPPPSAPAWDEVMDGLWHALTNLARSDDLTQFHHRKEVRRLPPHGK